MDAELRQRVRERAGHRCEYCRLRQEHEPARLFHIEHIVARQHRGADDLENLALACQLCNWLKGPNLAGRDPDTDALTRLFHPRQDKWEQHLHTSGAMIAGITDVGRTTVWLLDMNADERVELRSVLIESGELD